MLKSAEPLFINICRPFIYAAGCFWLILVLFCSNAGAGESIIIYPDREGIQETQSYPFALLKLAVQKNQTPCRLVPSSLPMTDARARIELAKKRISIAWFGTSKNLNRNSGPFPFPLPGAYWDTGFWSYTGMTRGNFPTSDLWTN